MAKTNRDRVGEGLELLNPLGCIPRRLRRKMGV